MLDLNDKTILVTGGCGFIGSNFIEYVDSKFKNLKIINVDKWGVGHRKINPCKLKNAKLYDQIIMDMCKFDNEGHWLNKTKLDKCQFDYVFHFAAESHVDRSISSPKDFIYNNVQSTSALLSYLLHHDFKNPVICVSTDEVYGHLGMDDPPFVENTLLSPRSPYAASKAASDLIALSFASTYGLDVRVTRCCNNFGNHQHDEKFIPTIIRSLINGEKIPVYGNGQNVREWIHVDQHNEYLLNVVEKGKTGGIYNIGSGFELNNLDLIKLILSTKPFAHLKFEDVVSFVEDRKGHDFRYAITSLNNLNPDATYDQQQLFEKTVDFYVDKYSNPDTIES
jgi:dTDP-glucose 4,6-dehydratase